MLKFNLRPLLQLKGATKLIAYLFHHGFTKNKAQHLIKDQVKVLYISDIEKLCQVFNCTPNDLFAYEESEANPLPPDSALKQLIRKPIPTVYELVNDLSLQEATDLINKLAEFKNQKT